MKSTFPHAAVSDKIRCTCKFSTRLPLPSRTKNYHAPPTPELYPKPKVPKLLNHHPSSKRSTYILFALLIATLACSCFYRTCASPTLSEFRWGSQREEFLPLSQKYACDDTSFSQEVKWMHHHHLPISVHIFVLFEEKKTREMRGTRTSSYSLYIWWEKFLQVLMECTKKLLNLVRFLSRFTRVVVTSTLQPSSSLYECYLELSDISPWLERLTKSQIAKF